MRTTLGVMAAMLALPAASFGLATTIGVQWADGSTAKQQLLPGAMTDSATVTLGTNEDLAGFQYAILASYDPDGAGPAPAVDAGGMFQYTAAVNLGGKAAASFTGASKLHEYADNGVLDPSDDTLWLRGEYTPGFGPNAVTPTALPTTLAAANPDVIFKAAVGVEVLADYLAPTDPNQYKVVTYALSSVGELQPGVYTLYTGNKAGLGFKACNEASGCVDATSGTSAVLTVLPEPASALLLLAAVPFLRRRRA